MTMPLSSQPVRSLSMPERHRASVHQRVNRHDQRLRTLCNYALGADARQPPPGFPLSL